MASARARSLRQVAGSALRHAALVTATVIVGIPFAWMLSTSLKELRGPS